MKTQLISNLKPIATRLSALLLAILLLPACAAPATPPSFGPVEELTFQSGEFKVVGDLRLPAGSGPSPVVLFVTGAGPSDRTGNMIFLPIMERMLQAGFATYAWDKPGSGESTPELSENDPNLLHKSARILLDAIELMKSRSEIDPARISVWGIDQAGYVIPIALTQTEDIAFVICVSCPGVSGVDQTGYQKMAFGLCQDMPKETSVEVDRLLKELDQNRTFETYAGYLAYRESMADLAALAQISLDNWQVIPEETWQANPIENEFMWNPVPGFSQVNIPVLAIYGGKDRQLDPLQGAYAYQKSLSEAGNSKSRVEVIPNAEHLIFTSKTGCPDEFLKTVNRFLLFFAITHGITSPEKVIAYVSNDPYKPGLVASLPYPPEYLDLIEEWLRNLYP